MITGSDYKGYPILFIGDRYWVGDQDHDDIGGAQNYIDEDLVGSGTEPQWVRALCRLHHEVERGEKLLYHHGIEIVIEDDDQGWTYNVGHYQTRNLTEAMDFAEGIAPLDPVRRRISDMLAKYSRDCAEERYRRLMRGESLDLGEEYSWESLEEQIRSIPEAGG